MARVLRFGCLLAVFILADVAGWGILASQETPAKKIDPFSREFDVFELRDESIFNGLASINQAHQIGFGMEAILPRQGPPQKQQDPKFTVRRTNVTVAQLLDWFSELDGRYVWERDGNLGNVYPREVRGDSSYLLNRKLRQLTFLEVPDAEKALFEMRRQLGDPTVHVMLLQVGGSLAFAEPWTATFHDITWLC
jgi:hypothetical protein